ncbi:universal stress protein [Acidisoma sp.]|uniref:universal stress protein n=1 Tax=Acidisoma sp. TaxID=1872115 RepID=UPI003B0075D9
MPFGRIIVPVFDVRLLEFKLDRALSVADRFHSRIDVIFVHAATDPSSVEGDPILNDKVLEMAEENWDRERPSADAVAALVNKWAVERGVRSMGSKLDGMKHGGAPSCRVEVLTNEGPSNLVRHARATDLIVIGQPDRRTTQQERELNKVVLMTSGRAILIVPAQAQTSRDILDHSILAWDGGLQVSRTVGLAMPLLEACSQVTVFRCVASEEVAAHEDEIVDYLRCNGITARCKIVTHDPSRVASSLLTYAQETGATLICMGAYSNSRALEILIGGNTQYAYHNSAVPILISA